MRYLLNLWWIWFVGISVCAAEDEWTVPGDPYQDVHFEVDVDLDICGTTRILNGVYYLADMGKRIFGYDSSAFIGAKKSLNDPAVQIEFVLALLIIDKYPYSNNLKEGLMSLSDEIKFGHLCNVYSCIESRLLNLIPSTVFDKIYANLLSLNHRDRRAIKSSFLEREASLFSDFKSDQEKDELHQFEQCLKSMLEKSIED
jgi:hypothetical protein